LAAHLTPNRSIHAFKATDPLVLNTGPDSLPDAAQPSAAAEVVLDYCAAVRGILNDDQGGPLHPPGVRMAAALGEVRESLRRAPDGEKGGASAEPSLISVRTSIAESPSRVKR